MIQIRRVLHRSLVSRCLVGRELSSSGTSLKGSSNDWEPYRAVHGVNVPYPKIPETMESYIFRNKRTPEQVEAALFEIWNKLTIRELEAAFYALKRMDGYPSTSLLHKLSRKTIELSDEITCRHVASIFLATSRLKFFDANLFDCLAMEALKEDKLCTFRGYYCGIIIYSLAVLHRYFLRTRSGHHRGRNEIYFPLQIKLLRALVERMISIRDEVGQTNQNLGNLVYGLGILEYKNDQLLEILASEAAKPERVETLNEQEISNMIYGFGLLRFHPEPLLTNLCKNLIQDGRLKRWKEQGLANLVYGLGLIQFQPPEMLIHGILEQVSSEVRLRRFYNQHLLNLTQGLAMIRVRNSAVFESLFLEIISRRKRFDLMLNGLANVVLCLTRIGIVQEGFEVVFEDLTMDRNLKKLSDQAIVNLLSAFSSTLLNQRKLFPFFERLIKEAVSSQRLSQFSETQFLQVLYGLRNSRFVLELEPRLVDLLIEGATVFGVLRSYSDQDLESLVFALTQMHYHDEEVHDRICKEVCNRVQDLDVNIMAKFIQSWSMIPYRNPEFLHAVERSLNQDQVIQNYSPEVLTELFFGLIGLDFQNGEVLGKILERIKHSDQLDQLIANASTEVVTELTKVDWIDEDLRMRLELTLKTNRSQETALSM